MNFDEKTIKKSAFAGATLHPGADPCGRPHVREGFKSDLASHGRQAEEYVALLSPYLAVLRSRNRLRKRRN